MNAWNPNNRKNGIARLRRWTISGGGGTIAQGESETSAWYLAGGIALANVVAAYQPKGAASLAASYINLANPGTYNLTVPTSAPAFDTTKGWTFNDTPGQYLESGITPVSGGCLIVQFANATASGDKFPCGEPSPPSASCFIELYYAGNEIYYYNGGASGAVKSGTITAGNLAVSANKAYKNGVDQSLTLPAWSGTAVNTIKIGSYNGVATFGGEIIALAYYTSITPTQLSLLATAMAAL